MKKFIIDDWKQCYKKFSIWFFIIIYWSPEIFAELTSRGLLDGLLPHDFISFIKILAVSGVVSRTIKQHVPENNKEKKDESNSNDKAIP